jgi:hypothetical protein
MSRHGRPVRRVAEPSAGRPCGFTLIEVAIALFLGTVTLGGLVALTSTSAEGTRSIGSNLQTIRGGVDALAALRHDLNRARVVSVCADGTSLTYRLPVPAGIGQATLDDAGEVIWGVSDTTGITVGGTVTLAFVPERTLRESESGADVNGDGDQTDVFDVGRISRTSSTGARLALPRLDVLLANGNRGGDIDGDGTADPLFGLSPDRRTVVIRLLRTSRTGSARLVEVQCAVAAAGP